MPARRLELLLLAAASLHRPAHAAPLNYTFVGRYALDGPKGSVETHGPPTATHCQIDRHDPNVGWPGYSRPNGTKHTSDAIFMPATALPAGKVACHLGQSEYSLITSGNATLSVLTQSCNTTACMHVPSPACCTQYPAYVELFAMADMQFGRRPYFYETEGSIIVLTDPSLKGQTLKLSATLPGGLTVSADVQGGVKTRVPFDLARVPEKVNEVVNISLAAGDHVIYKRRRFARHPPPPQNSTITAFQLDHERGGALRASGAEFLSQGWFNGGYNHQVDGLGAKFFAEHFGVPEPNWYERQTLNLGAIFRSTFRSVSGPSKLLFYV